MSPHKNDPRPAGDGTRAKVSGTGDHAHRIATQRPPIDRVRDAVETSGRRTRTDTGGGFRARCPAHDGRSDGSLAVREAPDGKILVYCHGGCTTDAVLTAIGLDWPAILPDNTPMLRRDPLPAPTVLPRIKVAEDDLNVWLAEAQQRLLSAEDAGPARAYLRARGVTGDDVRRFGLGLAPADNPPGPLDRLRSRIVFAELPWRVEGRVVPGWEDRTYRPERKYQTEGPKRAWGGSEPDPQLPVVLVEGPLDRIAVARIAGADQTVALCGSSAVKREDVIQLAERGVLEVLLLLDHDVAADKLDRVMRDLANGGIRPVAVTGLDDGDPGDLLPGLTAGDDDAWRALSHALTIPEEVAA